MPFAPRPRPDPVDSPHPSRLPTDHPARASILAAHEVAVGSGADGYVDPASGYWVFTAQFLLDRETCCETGCRHCPYVGGPDLPDD
ncbi:MAG: DUF5522 domain-containing protein [Actinomycetota bacterium]